MHFIGVPALIRRRRRRYQHIGKPHLTPRFIEQVEYSGFARGLLSMFRSGALGNQAACYEALRRIEKEILVITGAQDSILPPTHAARVRELLPPHSHQSIEAEHIMLLTHPEVVVDALVRWSR